MRQTLRRAWFLALALASTLTCLAASAPPAVDEEAERAQLEQALSALEILASPSPGLDGLADPRASLRARLLARATGEAVADRARALSQDLKRRAASEDAGEAAGPVVLRAPVRGSVVTLFGGRMGNGARSAGLEFAAAPGATVVSPASAVVDFAGDVAGWGKVAILRGRGNLHFVLAGMARIAAVRGEAMAAGEPVGAMSRDRAARLYLEVRQGERPIDPAPLLQIPARARPPHGSGIEQRMLRGAP
ncbi:MAG TPA: peptidoglycan DD-metalloendopeptidase family protein [Caulobacteraceae bacterium]|nr:peptidoglycan DD-metalloendopeptidase family protein [Caulobacteraceae bacterium]